MSTFKTLRSSLENLDLEKLTLRLKAVEADIENLEEELEKRIQLLKYIDSLISKKKGSAAFNR
jgi:hypothetical protein